MASLAPSTPAVAPPPSLRLSLRLTLARLLAQYPVSTDLAEAIATPAWWRGLGVLGVAVALPLAIAPDFAPLPAPPATALDANARETLRSLAVAPLALGGDMGARLAPALSPRALVVPTDAAPERPRLDLVATLATGDTLATMLARAGVTPADAAALARAIAPTIAPEDIAAGTRFDLVLGARPKPSEKSPAPSGARPLLGAHLRARFDAELTLTRSGPGQAFAASIRALPVDETPLRIRGQLGAQAGSSLYRAARAAGAPMPAIQQFLATIDAHLSLDEVHAGDTFDMILAYRRAAGGERQVGDLLYAAIESGGKPRQQLLRWGGTGSNANAQFFDAASMTEQRSAQSLIMPVAGARITSGFGMRYHPVLGFARMHSGNDLAAPWGSAVYAVADGIIQFVGPHGGHGNYIRMDHGGGVATGYGHLSRFAVNGGMRVRAGQVIGYVGSTGLSTGPHLHYEVFRNGASIDPMSAHFTVRAAVDKREIAAFRAKLANLLRVKPGAALAPFNP